MKRLILLLVLTLCIPVVLAQDITGTTLDYLNVRSEPAIEYNVLAQIPINTTVRIQGRDTSGAWLLVNTGKTSGWVASRYVDRDGVALMDLPVSGAPISTPPTETAQQPVTVISDTTTVTTRTRLNLRSEPGTSAAILDTLDYEQTVTVIGRNADGSWLAVDTGNLRGWISSAYVDYAGDINSLPVHDDISEEHVTTVTEATTDIPEPVTRGGEYVITGPAPGNSTSYDMEFTLHWNTTANLDLRVTGPDGYTIVPGVPPSPTDGYFQQAVGANDDCNTAEGAALEVITWDKGTAPSGLYHIEAEYVNNCFPEQEDETLFWVSVKDDGPEVEFWVYFIEPGDLFEFDYVRP